MKARTRLFALAFVAACIGLAPALRQLDGVSASEGIVWGLPHTAAEYSFKDLTDYIDACCK